MAANMKKKRLSMAAPLRVIQESDAEGEGSPLVKANDDEKERRERRKSMAIQFAKRDLILTPRNTPKKGRKSIMPEEDENGEVPANRSILGSSELTDLYANCIKMCTENKINQKNSWSLNLIDYISEVLDVKPGEMTNFQVASCTLDASVKIYSCRVDSVLSDTFKVLGGLNRTDAAPQQEDGEDGGEGKEDGSDENAKKAKPARAKTTYVTLEANVANLNVKKFDLEFDIDPLFRKTSAAFDEGGAKGLLLNHLTVQDGCSLLFDAADKVDGVCAQNTHASASMLSEFWATFAADIKDIAQRKVCNTFSGFTFSGWEPSETTKTGQKAKEPTPPPALDIDLEMDHDIGGYDGDDDYAEIFAGGNGDAGSQPSAPFVSNGPMTAAPLGTGQPGDIVMALASTVDDYSYFNARKMANWAGPSHWKLRQTATDTATTEGRKRAPKTKFTIDFSAPAVDRATAFAHSRAATTLSKTTLQKSGTATLLPDDVHYSLNDLTKLFCKPSWTAKVMGRQRRANEAVDAETAPYDYSNPNDVNNYCAQNMDGGDDGDDGGDMASDNVWDRTRFDITECDATMLGSASSELAGDNLLRAPPKVEKIDIHYERVAKRINVKQLKATMWEELAQPTATPAILDDNDETATTNANTKSFADVFSVLPSKVGGSTSAGLSVPIAFVCLLHLANEKSLALKGSDMMNDLLVTKRVDVA